MWKMLSDSLGTLVKIKDSFWGLAPQRPDNDTCSLALSLRASVPNTPKKPFSIQSVTSGTWLLECEVELHYLLAV